MSAEQTLLAMTQNILSALGSDEVNSISDTTESMQVATIIQNKYYDIISRGDLPDHDQIFHLTASDNPDEPTLMYLPEGISKIDWMKYFDSNVLDNSEGVGFDHDLNVDIDEDEEDVSAAAPGYKYVTVISNQQFIDMINKFNPAESNVGTYTFSDDSNSFNGDFTFYYKNDRTPEYCTILSNYYVIFDAFDNTQDTTLQSSKTLCFGEVIPAFTMTDTFIPDLNAQQFPLLLNEAKALAFFELKQMSHAKADQETKRQWSSIQKDKSVTNRPSYFDALPNFGRRGRHFV